MKKMGIIERRLQITPNVHGGILSGNLKGKILKAGVGKDGMAKPKTGAISGRAQVARPIVKSTYPIVEKLKKHWIVLVAAIGVYFLFLKGK